VRAFLKTAVLVVAALGAAGAQPAPSAPTPGVLPIRVLVATAPTVTLTFPQSHTAFFPGGAVLTKSTVALEWRLSLLNGRVAVQAAGGLYDTGRDRLSFEAPSDGAFRLNGRAYRGGANVIAKSGNLTVVNVLNVEEYVRGVLPREMPPSWPFEALKAQAVIARTYAASRLSQAGDYDVCATTTCQVYEGAAPESARTDEATLATRGLIVAYDGRPARTYFSSDSGGFTASAREAWGESLPYLIARPDPDSKSPRSAWTVTPDAATLQSVLGRYAPKAGAYRSLAIVARSESGRVSALEVAGAAGSQRVEGARAGELLRALGAHSSLVNVASTNPLTLAGSGWGHGVGLSQYGAKGMAERGWRFDQILAYYYPGVTLASYELNS
jgi:stage II sporulation protein D